MRRRPRFRPRDRAVPTHLSRQSGSPPSLSPLAIASTLLRAIPADDPAGRRRRQHRWASAPCHYKPQESRIVNEWHAYAVWALTLTCVESTPCKPYSTIVENHLLARSVTAEAITTRLASPSTYRGPEQTTKVLLPGREETTHLRPCQGLHRFRPK